MKETVAFTYHLPGLVRQVLQIFIEQYSNTVSDQALIHASCEVIQEKVLDDDRILEIVEEWSKVNDDRIDLFHKKHEDSKSMWDIIWNSPEYYSLLCKYQKMGYAGDGVFDETTQKFVRCESGEHYGVIKEIIEDDHPELWEKHQAFVNNLTKDTQEVDDFIMTKLVLVGKFNGPDWYKLSERKY